MTLASCGGRTTSPLRRRVSFEDFFSRLWRMPAPCFMTLPEPVILKRFLAPECVFCLGILFLCLLGNGCRCTGADGCGIRRLVLGAALALCALRVGLGLRIGLVLVRADDHDHVATVDGR